MGERRHIWHRRPCEALSVTASFTAGIGWSVRMAVARPGDTGMVSDRYAYDALSSAELLDVLEVTFSQALEDA